MQFRAARSLKEWKHFVRKTDTNSNTKSSIFCYDSKLRNTWVLCSLSVISHNTSLTICASADSSYLACALAQLVLACREVLFVYYRETQLQNVMVDTCEHISWPQGRPSHPQSLQPFEEVLEGLEQATILPVEDKWIECCWKHKQYNQLFWSCYHSSPTDLPGRYVSKHKFFSSSPLADEIVRSSWDLRAPLVPW